MVSVNTIEHTHDPAAFLAALSARLRPGGRAVIICPVARPANCELLFFDHLWTLSPAAFAAFAAAAGCRVFQELHAWWIARLFQAFLVEPGNSADEQAQPADPSDAVSYLKAWQMLDGSWCNRLDACLGPFRYSVPGRWRRWSEPMRREPGCARSDWS